MSQRMTMDEVLKEYGVPQIRLDVHAARSDLLKLREKLIAIRANKAISTSSASSTSTWTTSTAIFRANWIPSVRSTPSPRT